MARNRTISPKVWDDPALSRMSPTARLLHIGLISLADDAGNVIAEPFILWKRLFCGDGVTSDADVLVARSVLVERGLVTLYEVDDVEYIHHPNFDKYQAMNRKYAPLYPLAPGQEYERTQAYKVTPKTRTEPADERRQQRMKMGPSDQELAAYDLMRACYAVIREHVDLPMSERAWSQRNKRAALDLLGSGKTKAATVAMLQTALTNPEARKYWGGLNRLDKLAEAWPKLEAFARNAGGKRTFERLPLEGAAS